MDSVEKEARTIDEAVQLGADDIGAAGEIQKTEIAAGVGEGRSRRHQGRARNLNGDSGQGLTLIVDDETAEGSFSQLRL